MRGAGCVVRVPDHRITGSQFPSPRITQITQIEKLVRVAGTGSPNHRITISQSTDYTDYTD